jgi:hypothetical protein
MHAGLLELLTAILAAVLNLSTLVANQPKIARRGLLVLLKTNSSLFEVVSTRVRMPSGRVVVVKMHRLKSGAPRQKGLEPAQLGVNILHACQ